MKYSSTQELLEVLDTIADKCSAANDSQTLCRIASIRDNLHGAMDDIAGFIAGYLEIDWAPSENMGEAFGGLLVTFMAKYEDQPCPEELEGVDDADTWE